MFKCWRDEKPADLHDKQVLLWRTKHRTRGMPMVFSGAIHSMHNGWTNTDHLLPPMTRWNGYNHLIPADLEWAPAPDWIVENATVVTTDRWGVKKTTVIEHKLVRLLEVEGVPLRPCPFCGGQSRWECRDGFIGAMPHQMDQFAVGCCLWTGYYSDPADAGARWNRRHADAYLAKAAHHHDCTIGEHDGRCSCGLDALAKMPVQEYSHERRAVVDGEKDVDTTRETGDK